LATDGGTIDLPVVGKEKKTPVLLFAAAAIAVIAYAIIEKRKQAAAAAAAAAAQTTASTAGQFTDPAGNVCAAPDPATGYCPGSPQDQQAQENLAAYGSAGTANSGYTETVGTNSIPVFTSNAVWAQYAEQLLGSDGNDATSAALGAYLTGAQLTEAQTSLVEEAIAVANYPPVPGPTGYPPSMNVSTASTPPASLGTCTSGYTYSATQTGATGEIAATGGTGWCEPAAPATTTPGTTTTPTGSTGTTSSPASSTPQPITVAPSGFRVVSVTGGDNVNLAWDALTPPAGEGPLTGYMIAYGPASGSQQYKQQVGGQTTEATVPGVGGGSAGSHYFELWALPAQSGGPHAGPVEATTTKT